MSEVEVVAVVKQQLWVDVASEFIEQQGSDETLANIANKSTEHFSR